MISGAFLLLSMTLIVSFSSTASNQETTYAVGAAIGPGVWAQLPDVTMGAGTLTLSWVASGPIELWVLNGSQFAAFQVNATKHTSTQDGVITVYWGPVPHLWSYTYSTVSSTGAKAPLPAGTFYLLASASNEVIMHSLSITSPSYEGIGARPGYVSYLFEGVLGALGIISIALGATFFRQPKGGGKHLRAILW